MAGKYLGDEFDIHGGGTELVFPHHENEIAQSRAAGRGFARFWVHHALLNLSGEKMAKSLGNVLSVPAALTRVRAVELRYYLAAPHYRSTIDFSEESLQEAALAYRRVEGFIQRASERVGGVDIADSAVGALAPEFVAAMNDDIGTPAAVAVIHDTVRAGNKALADSDEATARHAAKQVLAMLDVFGLHPADPAWAQGASGATDRLTEAVDALVAGLLEQRQQARADKDFAAADAIRDRIKAAGIEIEDTPQGPRWSLGQS